ncbi:MAG: hypothetical protein H6Q21_2780, partial [Bacteroidetes bacterium]|nr:hypothetical protein [Bacteroidota bacterium]
KKLTFTELEIPLTKNFTNIDVQTGIRITGFQKE